MADSVNMMDVAAMTRGLREFRRIDPEQRVLADRMATEAAVSRVEQSHRDVDEAQRSEEARLRDDDRDRRRGRRDRSGADERREAAAPDEPVPERDEGRVLDIKV